MATIRDIAKKANVAVSTVSYVLNDTKHVRNETRARIMQAIDELSYTPRSAAIALKTKKTLTIGIIIPEISNPFFTEIIKGVEDTTYENGYNIVLCCTQEDEEKEKKYLRDLISKDIDGLIFVSTGKNKNILKNYKQLPIVVVDRKMGDYTSMVIGDNVKGGYIATKYLLEKSNKPVHLLTGTLTVNTYFDRMAGYMDALREKGIEYEQSMVHECGFSIEDARRVMDQLIESGQKIHSIFASADILALGALKSLLKHGIDVGKEVLLVGYDDINISEIVTPSLTTIRQPQFEMGVLAANLIIEQIKDKSKEIEKVIIEPMLVKRETA